MAIEKTTVSGRAREIPIAQREGITLDLIGEIDKAVAELTNLDNRANTKRFIKGGQEVQFSRQFEESDGIILFTGQIKLSMIPLIQAGAEPKLGKNIILDFRHPLGNFDEVKKVEEVIGFLTS